MGFFDSSTTDTASPSTGSGGGFFDAPSTSTPAGTTVGGNFYANQGNSDSATPSTPSVNQAVSSLPENTVTDQAKTAATSFFGSGNPAVDTAVNSLPTSTPNQNINTETFGQKYSDAMNNISKNIGGAEFSAVGGLASGFGDLLNFLGSSATMQGLKGKFSNSPVGQAASKVANGTQAGLTSFADAANSAATKIGTNPEVQKFGQSTGEFAGKQLPLLATGSEAADLTGIPAWLDGMLKDVPVVGKYIASPVVNSIKNLAAFSTADQPFASKNFPDSKNPHWDQFVSDLGNSALFGLTGSIPKSLYSIPATGIAAYASAKLGGASNGQALASALLIAGLHASGTLGNETINSPEEANQKAQADARATINKYATDKIDENSTYADINKAFRQAAKAGYSGIEGADEKIIKGLGFARDFLKSNPDKALSDFKSGTPSATPEDLKAIAEEVKGQPKAAEPEPISDILVGRHGDIDKVDDNIAHGQTNDPLNEEGIVDAQKLGQEWQGKGIKTVVSSDLPRGKQTAQIAAKSIGAIVKTDPNLRTWDIGKFNGQPKAEVDKQLDYYRAHPNEVVPGGESFQQFQNRINQGIQANKGDGTAFVMHNEALKALGEKNMDTGDSKTITLGKENKETRSKIQSKENIEDMGRMIVGDEDLFKGLQKKAGQLEQRKALGRFRQPFTPNEAKESNLKGIEAIINRFNTERSISMSATRQLENDTYDEKDYNQLKDKVLSEIPRKQVETVTRFLDDIGPDLFGDVGLSIRKNGGKQGQFEFTKSIITIFKNDIIASGGDFDRTTIHELWHSLSRYLPLDTVEDINKTFLKEEAKYVKKNPWFEDTKKSDFSLSEKEWKSLQEKYPDYKDVLDKRFHADYIGHGQTLYRFQFNKDDYRFKNLDEWFAETSTDKTQERFENMDDKTKSVFSFFKDLIRKIINAIKRIFGKDQAAKVVDDFVKQKYTDIQRIGNLAGDLQDTTALLESRRSEENGNKGQGDNIQELRKELETAQGHLDMAVANKEVFGDKIPELKAKVDDLRKQIAEAKNPSVSTAREALANAEKRVGVKAVDIEKLQRQLDRTQESLKVAQDQPEAHQKAYGRDKVPEYKEKINDLTKRLDLATKIKDGLPAKKITVSNKEVELPQELAEMEAALALEKESIDENPLKNLTKYVQKTGQDAGHLPDVTGDKNAASKFRRQGDAIIQEALPESSSYKFALHTDEVREAMDKYLDRKKAYAEAEKQFKEEKADYVKSVKDEIALDKLGQRQAESIEKEISKLHAQKKEELKAQAEDLKTERASILADAKKYGFTVPEYDDTTIPQMDEIINAEDRLMKHPARPFLKYMNKRTGILPEIQIETPGTYGSIMRSLLTKKGYTSVADAQKTVNNYIAQAELVERMAEERFFPLEMNDATTEPPIWELEKERLEKDPDGKSVETMVDQKDKYPLAKKVGAHDYFRTPKNVLKKIGLEDEGKFLKKQYSGYLKELPKNIDKITEWKNSLPEEIDGQKVSERIFHYLNGTNTDSNGFIETKFLTPAELKVANQIKDWLSQWADWLHLDPHQRLNNYITHVFDDDLLKKEFDEDLAKIIRDKIPGEVYNPFMEKRLGALGYKMNAWNALDAYVKRATRKVYMDPALEQIKVAATKVDSTTQDYIQSYINQLNKRPTQIENLVDNTLKQAFGYKLGQRPTARISRLVRQTVSRATIGLNPTTALKILMQGTNTYAKLGEKHTLIGYSKLLNFDNQKELDEEGINSGTFTQQDRVLSATRKFWQTTDKVLYGMMEAAIKINRGSAYFGAKSKYYDENSKVIGNDRVFNDGASEEKAREYATDLVENTQFSFGQIDIPVALGSDLAKVALQFQSFNTKQAEFMAQMIKDREYKGMIRYILATIALMLAVGKAFKLKWSSIIPFSTFKLFPALQSAYSVFGDAVGLPNKFGVTPSKSSRISDALYNVASFIPAGVQGSKTIQGIESARFGETPGGYVRSVLFGPQTDDNSAKINTYYQKSAKTAQTKLDSLDPSIVAPAQQAWNQVKQVGVGTPAAQKIVDGLSDNEYTAYKDVKNSDTDYWNQLGEKVTPIVEQASEDGFGTPAANKLVQPLSNDEYKAYTDVKTALYGKATTADISGTSQEANTAATKEFGVGTSSWDKQSFVDHIANIAKALGTNPVNAFQDIFQGDWRIVGQKNGEVIVNRMSEQSSQSLKKSLGGENAQYKLDHTIPLEVGGTNTRSNLALLTTAQWVANTPIEDYLGKALNNDKITGAQAREYAIRFKAGTMHEPLSSQLMGEYKNKYNSQPLTFSQIQDLVGESAN